MFGNNKSKYWDTTKAIMQAHIGKADEELTDAELVDAILESAKNGVDDPDGGDGGTAEPKTKAKADDKGAEKADKAEDKKKTGEADTKSEFTQLIAKIDLIANGQTELGKRLAKVETLRAKAATNGERELEDQKGKPRFDAKKDAPVFEED